jgi:vancomycin resistance protein YoaR
LIETVVDAKNQILDINLRGVANGRTVRVVGPKITGTTPAPKDPIYVDDPTMPMGEMKQTDKALIVNVSGVGNVFEALYVLDGLRG